MADPNYALFWNEAASDVPRIVTAEAARQEAEEVLRDMVERCPVDTGDLRSTLGCEAVVVGESVLLVASAGGEAASGRYVDYAEFVERGTARSPAQPVLTPAMDAASRRFPERIRAVAAARGIQVR